MATREPPADFELRVLLPVLLAAFFVAILHPLLTIQIRTNFSHGPLDYCP